MSVENEKIQDVTKNIETNEAQATELKSDELEQVTGGTVKEYEQLISAIAGNDKLSGLTTAATHAPIGNLIASEFLEDFLEDNLGIKTDISLGVLGTGAFSSHNTYTDKRTGRSLTHEEVIEIIQRFC